MTDDELGPLPDVVTVTQAFMARAPTQRVQDALTRIEGGNFGDLIQAQPFRVTAFRALLRDNPGRDLNSLWLHAYDVEVEITEVDPTANGNATALPHFAGTTE